MTSQLVPFGKYKGQPVEAMLGDTGYREWAMAQPWFRERYPAIHQVIVNYGGEPADTPEHNAMQAAFLDAELAYGLAALLYPPRPPFLEDLPADLLPVKEFLDVRAEERTIDHVAFEVRGWDVQFETTPAKLRVRVNDELPACVCECDHAEDCSDTSRCRGGPGWRDDQVTGNRFSTTCCHDMHHRGEWARPNSHCDPNCFWSQQRTEALNDLRHGRHSRVRYGSLLREPPRLVNVELKPDLGDDFPAVLRQVLGYKGEGARCVVARRHGFEQVTWQQVRGIYEASGVVLLSEHNVLDASAESRSA
jgi:hypothetical protein